MTGAFTIAFSTAETPSSRTLAKYGMTANDWAELLWSQGGTCAICRSVPGSGRLFVDHEHVKGFNKLDREGRRRCVRGILCYTCNRFRVCKNTLDTGRAVVDYLGKERHWT